MKQAWFSAVIRHRQVRPVAVCALMTVLVTGAAGFIGFHTARRLCLEGLEVVGIDNLNDYYDVALKQARLKALESLPGFRFRKMDIVDKPALMDLFGEYRFTEVVHLAAQAGVRYSLDNPDVYAQSNLVGFLNVLEACRHHRPEHLIYASSSSVYGTNSKMPFSVEDAVDHPVSLYAASKRANELMAHSYCHLYGLKASGLRFFTVYGPWGRPGHGAVQVHRGDPQRPAHRRLQPGPDVARTSPTSTTSWKASPACASLRCRRPRGGQSDSSTSVAVNRWRCWILSIAWSRRWALKARRHFLPMQDGDVVKTWADVSALQASGSTFGPQVSVETGVGAFVQWYRQFYQI